MMGAWRVLLIVLAILAVMPDRSSALAQAPETVFKGTPVTKISEGGVQRTPEQVSKANAPNLVCVISKIGDKFYWASRENKELVEIDGGGAYITYVAVNGSGYIRLLKPEMKKMTSLVSETDAAFDYVEHLTLGLQSVTYYGTRAR